MSPALSTAHLSLGGFRNGAVLLRWSSWRGSRSTPFELGSGSRGEGGGVGCFWITPRDNRNVLKLGGLFLKKYRTDRIPCHNKQWSLTTVFTLCFVYFHPQFLTCFLFVKIPCVIFNRYFLLCSNIFELASWLKSTNLKWLKSWHHRGSNLVPSRHEASCASHRASAIDSWAPHTATDLLPELRTSSLQKCSATRGFPNSNETKNGMNPNLRRVRWRLTQATTHPGRGRCTQKRALSPSAHRLERLMGISPSFLEQMTVEEYCQMLYLYGTLAARSRSRASFPACTICRRLAQPPNYTKDIQMHADLFTV